MTRLGCLTPLLMAILAPFLLLFGISEQEEFVIPPTVEIEPAWVNFGANANSTLTVNVPEVMLRVCSSSLADHTLYVRMWRDSFGDTYPARTWQFIVDPDGSLQEASYQDADSTLWTSINNIEDGAWVASEAGCVTLRNMEGPGDTLEGVVYNTAASLGTWPSEDWSIPCYSATDGLGLCDSGSR